MSKAGMSELNRCSRILLPLILTVLLGSLYGQAGARLPEPAAPAQVPGPSQWTLLGTDPPSGCGPGLGNRDVEASYWAAESGYVHLRLCTASAPGWSKQVAGGWSDARYKWWLRTARGTYMLLVEDFPSAKMAGVVGALADGMGEVTLIDDRNGNHLLSDDWASTTPPAYLNNAIGSPFWRRAYSRSTGSNQAAVTGQVGDVGFSFGRATCGPVVDMYVRLDLIGSPDLPSSQDQVCLRWATDDEDPNLDVAPGCDTASSTVCVPLSQPPPDTPVPTATPTRTAQPPIDPSPTEDLQTATFTPTPSQTATSTATVTLEPTVTDTPSEPPTATRTATATATATATGTATATASSTPTGSVTATASLAATATFTLVRPTVASTATPTQSALVSATPTALAGPTTATPTPTDTSVEPTPTGTTSATPTATPGAGPGTPPFPPSPPPPPVLGCLTVCVREMVNGQSFPFPEPATVHAVLLTPWGAPAKPAISLPLDPNSCTLFPDLEPGQYRVWVTVPPGWTLHPGSASPQTVWVYADQPCSQVVFRYQRGAVGPPPFPGTTPVIPTPPTITTATPEPTPYPASPDRPNVGAQVQLPVLGYLGNDPVCSTWVEAQNIGDRPAKALLLVWGAPGYCPPQCAGPLKVECSGLLRPGSAWNFLGAQVPTGAKSGLVVSANIDPIGDDIFADALCEALFHTVVGDCDEFRRFRKAFDERSRWNGFDFGLTPSQPMAVEVLRSCPGDIRPGVRVTGSYAGISGEFLGHWDPVYGGYAYFAPSLFATSGGFDSILYIQNAGLECTSIELWFKAQDACMRPRVCDILTLAPGESHQFDASSCMPPGWIGGAWVRSSQPLAIVVDHIGSDVLMTYTGQPAELNYTFNGQPLYTTGSAVAYGPLAYSEYQGWDTAVVVQNLSSVTAAKVKVYFLDRAGGVITTIADWVCPQGTQTFFLPVIASLPGNWVGAVRVESQDWFTPGGPAISAPNLHAVALLIQYTDVARSDAQEAIAYNLFPEQLAFDWQLGNGSGGLASGVGRIGIPSFLKDRRGTGVTSELAIANVVAKPGITNFALFVFDQNGMVDYLCESLSNGQVEYINLANWGFIHPGFKGSAVISATFWEHEVFDRNGGFTRNLVGLAAVKVERSGTTLASPIPGDESAGNAGFPIPGPLPFTGPVAPRCPGQPGGSPAPGRATATPPVPPPPGNPTATMPIPPPPGPPIP